MLIFLTTEVDTAKRHAKRSCQAPCCTTAKRCIHHWHWNGAHQRPRPRVEYPATGSGPGRPRDGL